MAKTGPSPWPLFLSLGVLGFAVSLRAQTPAVDSASGLAAASEWPGRPPFRANVQSLLWPPGSNAPPNYVAHTDQNNPDRKCGTAYVVCAGGKALVGSLGWQTQSAEGAPLATDPDGEAQSQAPGSPGTPSPGALAGPARAPVLSAADGPPPGAGLPVTNEQPRQVSWKLVVPNFFNDQKRIWLFPFHGAEKHWVPTLAVSAVTVGLVALDPYTAPYFRRTHAFTGFNKAFTDPNTEKVFLGLPVVWYFGGLASHSSYAQQTAFFAGEALADVDFLAGVMRSVDGRLHPRDVVPYNGNYRDTWFKARGTYFNRGSFPSGHTAGSFAIATIFARRYGRQHKWVPPLAYGLAFLGGASRITESAHFPSDVFLGGALSYAIARFVVLRNASGPE